MNCKPGDLAIVVAGEKRWIGLVIRILSQSRNWPGCWYSEEKHVDPENGMRIVWFDWTLRPIRPDETPEESIEAMRKLHDLTEKVSA